MSVTIASSDFNATNAKQSSYTLSVNRLAGQGLLVFLNFAGDTLAPDAVSSVVWDAGGDNQTFTLLQSQEPGAFARLDAFYLPAPTSAKTADVTVNMASANYVIRCAIHCRHITGHDSASAARGSNKFAGEMGSATPISHSLSSAVGDLVVDGLMYRSTDTYLSADGSQGDVDKRIVAAGVMTQASSSKAGDTSVSMGWSTTDTTPYYYVHILASIKPAAAGGGVPCAADHYRRMSA